MVQADATGKIYSSASMTAVVVRPSPNITEMTKNLIAEANDIWDELYERSQTLLFHKNSLLPKGQNNLSKRTTRDAVGRDMEKRTNAQKGNGDAKIRNAAYKRAQKFYVKEWGEGNAKHVERAFSDLKAIWSAVEHEGFQMRMNQLTNTRSKSMKSLWTKDAVSLNNRFITEYKKQKPLFDVTAFRAVYDVFVTTHSNNIKAQTRMFDEFFDDLKQAWIETFLASRLAAIESAMEEIQQQTHSQDVYIKNDGSHINQPIVFPTVTTIRPFDVVHIQAADAPMLKGYPRQPKLWVRCTPVLSSNGEILSANRAKPIEFTIGSDQRWIADENYWSPDTGVWSPINNTFNYSIRASEIAPILNTQTYVQGNEQIIRKSFRLTEGSQFFCRFNNGLDSLNDFTISMVIAPNPTAYPYPILDYWFGELDPVYGDRFAWWLNDRLDFLYGGSGGSVDQMAAINKVRPLVITSTVRGGICTTYVGYSHKHNMKSAVQSKVSSTTQWMRFQIGGTYLELNEDQYADFNLYEMNMWARALSNDEVISLHSDYYSIYGVSNDWR